MGFPPKDGTIRGFWVLLEKFEKPFLLRASYLGLLVHFFLPRLFLSLAWNSVRAWCDSKLTMRMLRLPRWEADAWLLLLTQR
jgi:hypothetical protein